MRIAVDAMGGDYAPQATVEGAVLAAREFNVQVVLVGDDNSIQAQLKRHGGKPASIAIQHASEVVGMHESPALSIRRKRDSSIQVAVELAHRGVVDAIITAGNTGAAVAATTLTWRMLEGIERPGISIVFPTLKGPCMLIDAGANIDAKPEHLLQYGIMGDVYCRYVFGMTQPRIGLVNIGEEETKGTEFLKETHRLLTQSHLHFIGNVEGKGLFDGSCDVVVCDGVIGNVVLKVSESVAETVGVLLKQELRRSPMTILGAMLSRSAFRAIKKRTDYSEFGGAPLLGVNGRCIVSHGRSSPKAIKNAIRAASNFVSLAVNQHIEEALATYSSHRKPHEEVG